MKYEPQRVQIAARVDWPPPRLLRRHVPGRAQHGPRRRAGLPGGAALAQLRQAEVHDFGVAPGRNENVRWLDIAMDDPLRMRRLECVGDLDPQRDQHLLLQGPAGNPVLQRFPLETLHDDEGVAVLIADVLNRADVRVTQRGRGVQHVSLDEVAVVGADDTGSETDLIALDDALTALARLDARKVQVVEMRFFGGLSVEETAEVLKLSTGTVKRDWRAAKAWLYRELTGGTIDGRRTLESG